MIKRVLILQLKIILTHKSTFCYAHILFIFLDKGKKNKVLIVVKFFE